MAPVAWTDEDIICAIQLWAEEHGAPPSANNWKVTGGDWPNATTVVARFGNWNNAIAAAGFPPSTNNLKKFDREEARRLRDEGLNNAEIGRRLGVSGGTISRALGGTPRPKGAHAGRHRSRERRIADLKKALEKENKTP